MLRRKTEPVSVVSILYIECSIYIHVQYYVHVNMCIAHYQKEEKKTKKPPSNETNEHTHNYKHRRQGAQHAYYIGVHVMCIQYT